MAKKRRYSDDERAAAVAAVAANGGNVERTAELLGIPESTLRQWVKGDRHPEAAVMSDGKKGELADRLEAIAWKLADAIPGKIPATGLQQLATTLGIVVDKMQLLRNRPTTINRAERATDDDLGSLTDDELERRLAEARSRAGSPPAGAGAGPAADGAGALAAG